jgi:hypothetical protein
MQSPAQKSKNDKIDLEKIYPTPKSFDELDQIRKEREAMFESRKPRHLSISTSVQLYTILVGLVSVIILIPSLIRFNVISGVFFSFLVSLTLLAYTFWIMNRISSAFYKFGLSARPFLFLYISVYIILLSLAYWLFATSNTVVLLSIGTFLHYVLVYILLKIIFNTDEK